ncbi:glycosyltransferase [Halorubrum halophilum]|uniref:glycosyltransferase n=1 Tax=Halorubrum halophilum TaxID=413816 RepID=UPI003743FB3D
MVSPPQSTNCCNPSENSVEDLDYDVSICVANYNMSDTIKESLNSVLEGIPSDYELVIVDESDDGSKKNH